MVRRQAWALDEVKRRHVDVDRFRTDPDYRREMMAQSFQRFDERSAEQPQQQVGEFRELQQESDRDRQR